MSDSTKPNAVVRVGNVTFANDRPDRDFRRSLPDGEP